MDKQEMELSPRQCSGGNIGIVQLEEVKAQGDLTVAFQDLKELQVRWS